MGRAGNILSETAKGCKIFLGTLAGTERIRGVKWVYSTPADCSGWTCRAKWVLQPAQERVQMGRGQMEGKGLLLQDGSAVCPGGYSNKVKASGPVHMRGSATAAEHGERYHCSSFRGGSRQLDLDQKQIFPSKGEIPILPTARGSLSFSLSRERSSLRITPIRPLGILLHPEAHIHCSTTDTRLRTKTELHFSSTSPATPGNHFSWHHYKYGLQGQ